MLRRIVRTALLPWRAWGVLLACVFLAACDDDAPADATDAGKDADVDAAVAFDALTFDIRPLDRARVDDVVDAAQGPCTVDRECARGFRCLNTRCVADACLTDELVCGSDRCAMRCVPTRDLCEGVRCAADQTCFAGRCIAGCFPSPCAGIRCAAGEFCDDTTGRCARITPCASDCGEGFACHLGCVPRSPCDGVTCPDGSVCANGVCQRNPCAGVTCAPGALCIDGRCTPTCGCDPPCNRSPRDRCVVGRCQCTSLCTSATPCGTDDGCGGRCVGPCPNPFAACEPPEYSCVCTPRCPDTARCGDDDGCGGRCTTGCGVGEVCDPVMRRCICVSRCPAPERFGEFGCGMPVPNECPGGPVCGLGTACPSGFRCSSETNMCECVGTCTLPDGGVIMGGGGGDGGLMCPMGMTACGSRCVNLNASDDHCGMCGAPCPAETHCMAGRCQCTGTLSLCSDHCVNTQFDNANCGGCGTTCPPRTNCMSGRCECIPACTVDANSVACGVDIPNACPGAPSCGVGRLCPSGTVCDTRARECVCVPRCPAGVRCGTSDGCGGQCVGQCDAGETCTQDSTDLHRYFCSAASCAGGCRCDEVCTMNRCTRVTCPFGDVPCPCACCPYGSQCVAGACVAIPP